MSHQHRDPAEPENSSVRNGVLARVVRNEKEWDGLAEHWDTLLSASPNSNPWQSWSYLRNWWRYLSDKRRLYIVVVERQGTPQLIMPLQLSRVRMLGMPIRALEPIGMWGEVNQPRFALGNPRPDLYSCAFEALHANKNDWDVIRIDEKTLDDDEVHQLKNYSAKRGLRTNHIFSHLCPYLDLRQDWDAFLAKRGSKMRKNIRAARRRLDTLGKVELRIHSTPTEIMEGFSVVLDLHKRSWKRRKKVEHSESANYQDFFRNWLKDMSDKGKARILSLHCNQQPVAATIAFLNGATYHSAQIVHDTNFNSCSPGTLLESMEIESLMNEKAFNNYDFLGSFLNNKMRWTDTAKSTLVVYALQDSMKNRIIEKYYFELKPFIKRKFKDFKASFRSRAKPALET